MDVLQFCFPFSCCEGGPCNMEHGIGEKIEDGILSVLQRTCAANDTVGSPSTCGATSESMALRLNTPCTSTSMFQLVLMVAISVGGGIIACTCMAVLCRYAYRVMYRRRFDFEDEEDLFGYVPLRDPATRRRMQRQRLDQLTVFRYRAADREAARQSAMEEGGSRPNDETNGVTSASAGAEQDPAHQTAAAADQ